MNRHLDPDELRALPVAERLKLIEDLWDSIDADTAALPLPDWQRDEIDRRLDALDADPPTGVPWAEARGSSDNGACSLNCHPGTRCRDPSIYQLLRLPIAGYQGTSPGMTPVLADVLRFLSTWRPTAL